MINEMDLRSSLPPMWFQTHTNMLSAFIYDSYKLLIPPLLYSEKVWKIILSCSLSCKRVHYQCLPKSLCLCSKRLSLLCFKRIISCPYKSTIILPLLKRLLPPAWKWGSCPIILQNGWFILTLSFKLFFLCLGVWHWRSSNHKNNL